MVVRRNSSTDSCRSDEEIQCKHSDGYRNEAVYKKITNELSKAGYSRSLKQCRDKIKQLITVENNRRAKLFFVSVAFDDVSSIYESETVHKLCYCLFNKQYNKLPILLQTPSSYALRNQPSTHVNAHIQLIRIIPNPH